MPTKTTHSAETGAHWQKYGQTVDRSAANSTISDAELRELVTGLLARGVTFVLVGNALKIRPWRTLTGAEQDVVQRSRPALKRLIGAEGQTPTGELIASPGPTSPAVGLLCEFCLQTPCVGPQHPAFRILHGSDPAEVARRTADATHAMLRMLPFGHGNY